MERLKKPYTKQELKAIFEKMDWDKDGTVSRIEFKSYLASLSKGETLDSGEVYKAFNEIDKDRSKSIDWTEFFDAMQVVYETKPSVTEDDITTIFNEIDRDGNGFITPREARRAYKKITERFSIEKSQIDEWVKACDFDQDGKISIEEFKLGIGGTDLLGHDD